MKTSGLFLIVILVSVINFDLVKGQYEVEHRIKCNDAYCTDQQIECPQKRNCTTVGFRKFLNPKECNCCEYCYDYLERGDFCKIASYQAPNTMCGPLLQCDTVGVEERCDTMLTTPCTRMLDAYLERQKNGTGGIADWLPQCGANGQFLARQCLSASSVCICMNGDGEGIFGMGFASEIMDCSCSRNMAFLDSLGVMGQGSHCLPNGNMDQLQCSFRKRQCHCYLKPKETVSFSELTNLTCYDPAIHSARYLRPCEHELGELNAVIYEAEAADDSILVADLPRCDHDGNYAAVQSRSDSWICVDPSNNQIGSYGMPKRITSSVDLPKEMTCLCARVQHFLGDNAGKPKCCPWGTFRSWQCTSSTCYCVDQLGRQNMTATPYEVHQDDVAGLDCYRDECPMPV